MTSRTAAGGRGSEGGVDEALQREIVAFLPRLRRFAVSLTGSRAEGDDLVQATCERAIRHWRSWEPGTRLDAWLYRIARNLFLNELRARRVRGPAVELQAADQVPGLLPRHDGQAAAEAAGEVGRLRTALARLPEEQRSVLLLVAVEGYGYREAAEMLALPIGTVTSRLARARQALQAWMADEDEGERSP